MKRYCLPFLIGMVLLLVFSVPPAQAQRVNIVDAAGDLLHEFNTLELDGKYFFDLHDFFKAIDFDVHWNESARRLTASGEEEKFRFTPGAGRVLVAEEGLYPAENIRYENGRLFLEAEQTADLLKEHTDKEYIWNPSREQLQVARAEDFQSEAEPASGGDEDPIARFLEEVPETEEEEILVVIDPGHGGRDPGAIGANGLTEKEIVLRISLQLRDYIEENYPAIKPVLTREDDRFIPLQDRTRMANEQQADVFMSIHANSGRAGASGFEVFTLSSEADDEEARELAEIENSALRYEGVDGDELEDIEWILHQLQGTVHTRESREFARIIDDELDNNLSLPSRGVKQAPFFVLKDARMPAVLVETGFLSNPREAEKLGTRTFQQEIAAGLAEALEYYRQNRY